MNQEDECHKEDLIIPKRRPLRPQFMISCVIWTGTTLVGMGMGHSAVLLPRLQRNDSGLPIDDEMGSWITSVFTSMRPVGCLIGGFSADKWGRCTTLKISMIFFALGWTLVASANSAAMLIAARVILGIMTGMATDSSLALHEEILDSRWRGLGVTISGVGFSVGVQVTFGLAALMEWRAVAGVIAIVPVAILIGLLFVPESPTWLMRHGRFEEARRVLSCLWTQRMEIHAYRESEILQKRCLPDKGRRKFLSRRVLKPFFIAHFFNFIQIFCGTNFLVFYTIDIIARIRVASEEVLDDLTVASISGFVRLVMLFGTCGLLMVVGRRPIAVTSSLTTGLCAIILGILLVMNTDHKMLSSRSEAWLCIVMIFGYVICSTPGLFILPPLMLGEIVPSSVRGLASGYIFAVNDLGLSGILKAYPQLVSSIGISGLFFIFGTSSLVCGVFAFLFLPETKDRTLNEVEDYFRQNNLLWQKRRKRAIYEYELQNRVSLDPEAD